MELNETIEMMNNKDYKERFKAEYCQLKIRYEKLSNMVQKMDKGELEFTPTCPREIYTYQLDAMKKYLDTLVIRAKIEHVEL